MSPSILAITGLVILAGVFGAVVEHLGDRSVREGTKRSFVRLAFLSNRPWMERPIGYIVAALLAFGGAAAVFVAMGLGQSVGI